MTAGKNVPSKSVFRREHKSATSAGIRARSGVAATELAVCLPFLLAIVFGSIETANAIFLQQALTCAAYEAGSVAAANGGTSSVATNRANGILTLLGVNSATVTVSPVITATTPNNTQITVTCSAPLGSNTATGWNLGNRTLTATYVISHL